MCDTTPKPAQISPAIEANQKYFAAHLQVVHCDFERLKHSPHVLENGRALTLIGACEMLLSAASELQQAISSNDQAVIEHQAMPKVDLYSFLCESKGKASNVSQPAPKVSNHESQGKSEFEFVFESVNQLAKYLLENPLREKITLHHLTVNDWKRLLFIKYEKAYKGLHVEIDGQQTVINTFKDYCNHSVGLTERMVNMQLKCFQELGEELFTAAREFDIGIRNMNALRKLPDDQKQAVLQVAQTGDKAKTLAFIQQALEAGE